MRFFTLSRVALRSLFLEASWNRPSQQGLGFAAALDPALREIYGPGDKLLAARRRCLFYFNSHPVMSGFLLGLAIYLEKKVASGTMSERIYLMRLQAAAGPLAHLGDNLFWRAWLPFCSLTAVWAYISLGLWWAAFLLPILYCALALPVRFCGFYLGYKKGVEIMESEDYLSCPRLYDLILRLISILGGASTVVLLSRKLEILEVNYMAHLWLGAVSALGAIFALRYLSRRSGRFTFWYPTLIVVVVAFVILLYG